MTRETITFKKVERKIGKKDNLYYKVNDSIFIWDEALGPQAKDCEGRTFECEVNRTTAYPKITEILDEKAPMAKPAIVVNRIDSTGPVEVAQAIVKESELVLIRDKPNSRTIGQGKDSIKIYFSDAKDLDEQINELAQANLMPLEWVKAQAEELEAVEKGE